MKLLSRKILSILGILGLVFVLSCNTPRNQDDQNNEDDMMDTEQPEMMEEDHMNDTSDHMMEEHHMDSDTSGM